MNLKDIINLSHDLRESVDYLNGRLAAIHADLTGCDETEERSDSISPEGSLPELEQNLLDMSKTVEKLHIRLANLSDVLGESDVNVATSLK